MRKILITAGAGKIGSVLISRLAIHKNMSVRVYVRGEKNLSRFKGTNVEFAMGCFEEASQVRAAVLTGLL